MKSVTLKIKDFPVSGVQVRPEFQKSVNEHGVKVPIAICQNGDGVEVIDGLRRIEAARRANIEEIDANVLSKEEAAAMTIILNCQRSPNPIAEADALIKLMMGGMSTYDQLYEVTGMPKATIDKRLKLMSLSEPMKEAVAGGKVKVSVAQRIASLSQEDKLKLDAVLEAKGKLTNKDVDEIRSATRSTAQAELPSELFDCTDEPKKAMSIRQVVESWCDEGKGNPDILIAELEKHFIPRGFRG